MRGSDRLCTCSPKSGVLRRCALAITLLIGGVVTLSAGSTSAATATQRVDLRVLLLDDNSPVGRCVRVADAGRGRALHGSATRVDNSSGHHRRVPLLRRRGLLPSRRRSRRGAGDVGSCRAHFAAGLRGEVRHPRGRRVQLPERHHRSQHADGRQRHRRHDGNRDRRRQDQWLRLPQRSRSLLGRQLQLPRRTAGSSVAASGGELHHPRRSPAAEWRDRLAAWASTRMRASSSW